MPSSSIVNILLVLNPLIVLLPIFPISPNCSDMHFIWSSLIINPSTTWRATFSNLTLDIVFLACFDNIDCSLTPLFLLSRKSYSTFASYFFPFNIFPSALSGWLNQVVTNFKKVFVLLISPKLIFPNSWVSHVSICNPSIFDLIIFLLCAIKFLFSTTPNLSLKSFLSIYK